MRAFKALLCVAAFVLIDVSSFAAPAAADNRNLVTDVAGRVTLEFLFSDAAFVNTLCVVSPVSACFFNTAGTNRARRFVVGTFAAGTEIEYSIQTSNGDTWSTDSANNSDNADHVIRTQVSAGKWRYNWEDEPNLGDADFNDIDVLVRIAGDSDGDGIWDEWETNGVDYDEDGTVDLAIQSAPYNAVVGVKDIFIEIDWFGLDANSDGDTTDPGDHVHTPQANALTIAQAAFRQANSTYPDGACHSAQVNAATGQADANCGGINLHLDAGGLGGGNQVAETPCMTMTGFNNTPPSGTGLDTVKAANFNDNRRGVFHYVVLGHSYAAAGSCQCGTSVNCNGVNQSSCPNFPSCSSGISELPGNDFIVTLGATTSSRSQAGTLMHEFGHNLNLFHGGNENQNYKPNYLSIMNYHHQFCGLGPIGPGTCSGVANYPGGIYDYSRASLGSLVENGGLNENTGISVNLWNANLGVKWACVAGATQVATGGGTVDWDCDGNPGEVNVNQNINPDWDANSNTVNSFFDWANVALEFQTTGSMEDGAHPQSTPENVEPPASMPEITVEICDGIDNDQDGVSDEGFDQDSDGVADCKDNCVGRANPDQLDSDNNGLGDACNRPFANAGDDIDAPLPADACEIDVQLDGSRSRDANGDTLSFSWSEGGNVIATGATPIVTLGPGVHTIELTVSDGSSSDMDSVVVTVSDITPPTISSVTATPACLNPVNHKYVQYTLVNGLAVVVSDACDPAPKVKITSVTSNQSDDDPDLGDGTTLNDTVAGNYGFCVRSERRANAERRYTVAVIATDTSGNHSNAAAAIRVPTNSASCAKLSNNQFVDQCTASSAPAPSGGTLIDHDDGPSGPSGAAGAKLPAFAFGLLGLLGLLWMTARRTRRSTALLVSTLVWLFACNAHPDGRSATEPNDRAGNGGKVAQPAIGLDTPDFQVNSTSAAGQTQPRVAGLRNGGFVAVFTDASQRGDANHGTRNPGFVREQVRARLFNAQAEPVPQHTGDLQDLVLAPYRPGAQREPDVAARPDGGFVAVWVDIFNGVRSIRGGLFAGSAAPLTRADGLPRTFAVSEELIESNMAPRVASFEDGGFVVTWQACQASTGHCDARGRLFDANGDPRQSALARDAKPFTLRPAGGGQSPVVAAFADGRFVAAMRTNDPAEGGAILYRIYDSRANPTGPEQTATSWSKAATSGEQTPQPAAGARNALHDTDEFQPVVVGSVAPATDSIEDLREPAVAIDASGRGIVTWRAGRGDRDAIFGRSFDQRGSASSPVFQISTFTRGRQARPTVVADAHDRFIVAWDDSSTASQDHSSLAILARRVGKTGPLDQEEFLVNDSVDGAQQSVALAPLAGGRIIALWTDQGRLGPDDSGSAIRGRLIDP